MCTLCTILILIIIIGLHIPVILAMVNALFLTSCANAINEFVSRRTQSSKHKACSVVEEHAVSSLAKAVAGVVSFALTVEGDRLTGQLL